MDAVGVQGSSEIYVVSVKINRVKQYFAGHATLGKVSQGTLDIVELRIIVV